MKGRRRLTHKPRHSWLGIGACKRVASIMALLALMATTVSALSSSGVAIAQTPGVPGAPSITSVTAGLNQLTPNWTPPVNTGTSAITDYEVRYPRRHQRRVVAVLRLLL